jgi:hypothetical protein
LIGATGFAREAPAVRAGALTLWTRAVRYHWTRRAELAPLVPALFVPFLSDVLHSVLIAREARDGTLDRGGALTESLRALPSLLRMKLAVGLYLVVPASAAVNTFLYLEVVAREGGRDLTSWPMPSSLVAAGLG